MLICQISSNICYGALHFEYFTHDFYSDNYMIKWQDIVYYLLFCTVNFIYVGFFRVMMVYADWKPWQVVFFKSLLILSSMVYFFEGLMFIYGKDKLSYALQLEKVKANSMKNDK